MADLNFPNSPVDGQQYEGYIFDGANSVWIYIAESIATNNEIARVTAAFNKANTALANTSGVWFNGNLNIGSATSNVYLGDTIVYANLGSAVSNSNSGLVINQTWNNSGQVFTAFKVNVTNTSSRSGSLIADFQINGVSRFQIANTTETSGFAKFEGRSLTLGLASDSGFQAKISHVGNETITFTPYGTQVLHLSGVDFIPSVQIRSDRSFGWSSGTTQTQGDLVFWRDAANTLGQRKGTGYQPQTYRLYNMYYNSSNNERLAIQWQANTINISSEAQGNGVIRPIAFTMNTNTVMVIANTGNVGVGRSDPSYKLDVVGTVNASAVLVNGSPITSGSGGGYFQGNNGDVGSVSGLGDIFRVHSNTLTQNVTISSGYNAVAVGPLSIASGKTLTIQTGARVSIV